MRAKFIYESVGDFLKPKNLSEINFKELKITDLYQSFTGFWSKNEIEGEPLIFTLNRKAEKFYEDCGDFGMFDNLGRMHWQSQFTNPPIGLRFTISQKIDIIVEQYDYQDQDYAWVYAQHKPGEKFKVTSFEQLVDDVNLIMKS